MDKDQLDARFNRTEAYLNALEARVDADIAAAHDRIDQLKRLQTALAGRDERLASDEVMLAIRALSPDLRRALEGIVSHTRSAVLPDTEDALTMHSEGMVNFWKTLGEELDATPAATFLMSDGTTLDRNMDRVPHAPANTATFLIDGTLVELDVVDDLGQADEDV